MTNSITREEFAAAVSAAVSSVHHLYREVNRLVVGLRDLLGEPQDPLVSFGGTMPRSGRDQTRLVIRNDYGMLFVPPVSEDDDEDEDGGEELDDEAEEEDTPRRRRKPVELSPDQALLGLQISLYDPKQPSSFEPHLTYGVMAEWRAGNQTSAQPEVFVVARRMLPRIPKILVSADSSSKGVRLQTSATTKRAGHLKKAAERRLSCSLPMGVETVPLYTMDTADDLARVGERMKAMWAAQGST